MSLLAALILGDVRWIGLADESVQCVVTSPPYWGLRDYGLNGRGIGLESTPEEYVANIVQAFREVRRVLRRDGTLWLNLSDSFAGSRGAGGDYNKQHRRSFRQDRAEVNARHDNGHPGGLKPKDMVGIPWRVAFALQADGWYLRSDIIEKVELYCPCGCGYVLEERMWRYSQDRDIIWHKPNAMPESVTDRPTRSHEYLFLLSKSANYYYDAEAIREPHEGPHSKHIQRELSVNDIGNRMRYGRRGLGLHDFVNGAGRNRRDVWTIATQPYKGAHFATFPEKLVEPCILAGTSPKACGVCGAPWERILERHSFENKGSYEGKYVQAGAGRRGRSMLESLRAGREATGDRHGNPFRAAQVIGWRPTCHHYDERYRAEAVLPRNSRKRQQHLLQAQWWWRRVRARPGSDAWPWVPCLVLDPFCGSGTVVRVARALGRRSIGVELKPEYLQLARERIDITEGMALT